MTANAGPVVRQAELVAARTASEQAGAGAGRPRGMRRGDAVRELKKRDNFRNFAHIGFVYLVIVSTIALTIWSLGWLSAPASAGGGISR